MAEMFSRRLKRGTEEYDGDSVKPTDIRAEI
jgi:hypothetical protein